MEVSNEDPNLEKSYYTSNLREAIFKTIGVSFVVGCIFSHINRRSHTIFVDNCREMPSIALSMKPEKLDCRSLKLKRPYRVVFGVLNDVEMLVYTKLRQIIVGSVVNLNETGLAGVHAP